MDHQALSSFIEVSNTSDFSIHNIPFGIFSTSTRTARPASRIGIKLIQDWIVLRIVFIIGDYIVDLKVAEE